MSVGKVNLIGPDGTVAGTYENPCLNTMILRGRIFDGQLKEYTLAIVIALKVLTSSRLRWVVTHDDGSHN
jgi:hypothetical protein